ncbi:MAG: PLD nuclease N-terminal domain-containing protein [Bacillota bacterium]|nr:PLD nuclease N-terminal domain-containing protein [Bacillota bacterium]MDW7683244.1 PLD nuclease N-terminal domain-containing protein [Bacillota bacterium]
MEIRELLIALWPLLAFQVIMMVAALISIARRGETKKLPKLVWVMIVVFINILGPILYFMLGKGESQDNEQYRD